MKRVRIHTAAVSDAPSFHAEFKRALGFLAGYGENWNAWIDCMSSISAPEDGMSEVTVEMDESLVLEIRDADSLRARCPEEYQNLVECTAAVNRRAIDKGEEPAVLLEVSS